MRVHLSAFVSFFLRMFAFWARKLHFSSVNACLKHTYVSKKARMHNSHHQLRADLDVCVRFGWRICRFFRRWITYECVYVFSNTRIGWKKRTHFTNNVVRVRLSALSLLFNQRIHHVLRHIVVLLGAYVCFLHVYLDIYADTLVWNTRIVWKQHAFSWSNFICVYFHTETLFLN